MTEIPLSVQLHGFADDLERSIFYDPGVSFDCDDIVLCGLGGSAVSGDVASDCCFLDSSKRIALVKYPKLPNWAGPRTWAVISSYSGNTAETLEMYRQARERGCIVVAITSGGKLRDLAICAGNHLVVLPEGMQPRHAIGYMIGYTLAVIHAAGGPDLADRIAAFIPSLRKFRDESLLPEKCVARRLAQVLMNKVPVICSNEQMRSVAFRWKTQLNENAKYVAFCDSEPRFRMKGLQAWTGHNMTGCFLVLLVDPHTDAAELEVKELDESGADFAAIRLGGETSLENMFRAIMLGDYVSMYIAQMRGIDPAEVRPVMQMKAKLSRVL